MTDAPVGPVWIVIAAYNEGKRLGDTLRGLKECGYDNIVVVDDGSRDDTQAQALAAGAWALRHIINLGQGAALQTGIRFALLQGAGIIVTFDADGQHLPEEVAQVVQPVRAGEADLALGSRFLGKVENMPWTRWLVLKGGVLFTWLVSGVNVTDTHNGFRALSRRAAELIRLKQNRMAHASEIYDEIREHGLKFVEVPVTIRYNEETLAKGQSSLNALNIVSQLLLGRLVK